MDLQTLSNKATATGVPTIEHFATSQNFRYLWLKYVDGYDLSKHCARSLLGKYSGKFGSRVRVAYDVRLNEATAECYYLCGVTDPYCWEENLHLAFRYKAGVVLEFQHLGTRITIRDAEQIEIRELASYCRDPHGDDPAYNTCRNWRFAYQMTHLKR